MITPAKCTKRFSQLLHFQVVTDFTIEHFIAAIEAIMRFISML